MQLRPYIIKAAQSLGDHDALRAVELYDAWTPGSAYAAGYKLRRRGKIWRVRQAHTSQTGWEPENAPALFEQISEAHAGTKDDPLPYSGNMELKAGLYYTQDGAVYLCIRDTMAPVHHALKDLAGTYVEVAA